MRREPIKQPVRAVVYSKPDLQHGIRPAVDELVRAGDALRHRFMPFGRLFLYFAAPGIGLFAHLQTPPVANP